MLLTHNRNSIKKHEGLFSIAKGFPKDELVSIMRPYLRLFLYTVYYVNDLPKITSRPQEFIQQGETFSYEIIVEDKNQRGPNNQKENN